MQKDFDIKWRLKVVQGHALQSVWWKGP